MATQPNYLRIAADIRQRVATGELSPGDRLPTAPEIAAQWGVSGAVVTQALGTLKSEGLLVSHRSRGTFVQAPRQRLTWLLSQFESSDRADTYAADDWAHGIREQGMEPSSTVEVRRIQATKEIAGWLCMAEGETVIARDRVRYADGQPYMAATSYFPAWVAAGTRLEEPGDQSAPGGLLAEAGHPQTRARDIINGPVVSAADANRLLLADGSRAWDVVRVGWDAHGRPVRAMRTTAPLDQWQLEIDHTITQGSPFLASAFSAEPYPGERPNHSFVELHGAGWVIKPGGEEGAWAVDTGVSTTRELDSWLGSVGAAPIADRLPVLAYGSNASPGKIAWLRDALQLTGPAIVLKVQVQNVAAVWSAGTRERDEQRPAVLAHDPGHRETHAVWLVTPEQRAVLDCCEGRGERYRLAWVRASATLDNATAMEWVLAYIARPEAIGKNVHRHQNRSPLLVDGEVMRMSDARQEDAFLLEGEPADSDGLEAVEASEAPSWRDLTPEA